MLERVRISGPHGLLVIPEILGPVAVVLAIWAWDSMRGMGRNVGHEYAVLGGSFGLIAMIRAGLEFGVELASTPSVPGLPLA